MKVVILAGGFGSRISEETHLRPKPMVEIGGRPILWHIMKMYLQHGLKEFIICCGYKGYVIKEYFANYSLHMSDITFDMETDSVEVHRNNVENWKITLVDTGVGTMTGGRLKRIKDYLAPNEPFCFTYGDGVADIDVSSLILSHMNSGKMATISAVSPPGRYGALKVEHNSVIAFNEKPRGDGAKINGGFFVLNPSVLDLIDGDDISWEAAPLEQLALSNQLNCYNHDGFWHAMDTLRDKNYLQSLWEDGSAPWKTW